MEAHAVHAALTANGHALAASLESMNIDADAMVFLIVPTSANLAAAVDDKTGTGALVFANSPVLVTPDIGTPSDGTLTNCDGLPAAGVVGTALVVAAIGTTVQAFSANLSEFAAVNPTAAGLALLDDADATAQRGTLGLGTAATANSGDFATAGHTHSGGTYQPADPQLDIWAGVTPGTGVATALAFAIGSAGAFVVVNGALGTPLTGTLTNCSGLPAAGVVGLGSLATQSGTFSGTSSGTNTGDQTITLTGAVTGSGTGSFVTTLANDAVTYAKMQNVSATDKLLGRSTAGAGDVEEIACTAAGRAILDDADATAQRATLGLVIGTNVQAYDAATAKTNATQTFTAPQRGTLTTDNDGSFDLNATNNFKCTTAGALALTFTNIAAGQSGSILFINASNHAITAAATTKVASGTLAAISVTGTYLLGYFSDGTNVYVAATGAMA